MTQLLKRFPAADADGDGKLIRKAHAAMTEAAKRFIRGGKGTQVSVKRPNVPEVFRKFLRLQFW